METTEELLADIINKLTPFKNLLTLIDESQMIYYSEPMLFNLLKLEIENCKQQIKYFESL